MEPVVLRAARRAGFTLIEVLVVLAIMAVVAATVVVMALPGDAEAARTDARRLAALLEAAMREARASGSSIAWSAERQGYAFWQRGEDGDWVLYPRTSLYRSRALAGRTEVARVRLDGRDLAPGERVVFFAAWPAQRAGRDAGGRRRAVHDLRRRHWAGQPRAGLR